MTDPRPIRNNFVQNVDTSRYGLHVPYNRGYDAQSGPHRVAGQKDDWNGRLIDQQGDYINLWVEEFETSFELQGSYAQSRDVRRFYPRSFGQPIILMSGRVANTTEYNRLASFIRTTQIGALHSGNGGPPTVGLALRGRSPWGGSAGRNAKGSNTPWYVEGLIKRVEAGAVAHNIAPEFNLEFQVAASGSGIYNDSLVTGREIMSWTDVLEKNGVSFTNNDDVDLSNVAAEIMSIIDAIF